MLTEESSVKTFADPLKGAMGLMLTMVPVEFIAQTKDDLTEM